MVSYSTPRSSACRSARTSSRPPGPTSSRQPSITADWLRVGAGAQAAATPSSVPATISALELRMPAHQPTLLLQKQGQAGEVADRGFDRRRVGPVGQRLDIERLSGQVF